MKTLPSNDNQNCSVWIILKYITKILVCFDHKYDFLNKVAFDNFIELPDLKILFKKLFLSYLKLLKLKDRIGLISA